MQNNDFYSKKIHQHSACPARSLSVHTPHGEFITPCFMPVGTRAFVNYMTPADLAATHSQIILGGNTYHMLVSPGMDVIRAAGGMHQMMNWHGPMLTDSGGFQVFSLSKNSKICKIKEDGAHFKHPVDGRMIHMTPTCSIETQKIIGADIIMAFDQCTPDTDDRRLVERAMTRTEHWLLESLEAHTKQPHSAYGYRQALFPIIQGSYFQDLRIRCTEFIMQHNPDGVAIGGESIGFDMKKTIEIIDWIRPYLPEDKVRYTMGVGLCPQDLLDVIAAGVDIFDCVAPTRNARHGALYTGKIVPDGDWLKIESNLPRGRLHIKKAIYKLDDQPIDPDCTCTTCQHHSRAYLHFLFKDQLPMYNQLASIHNVHMMQMACDAARACIQQYI